MTDVVYELDAPAAFPLVCDRLSADRRSKGSASVPRGKTPGEVQGERMTALPGRNKLKMGSAGRYYGAYLVYDAANSCLATLHAKMPAAVTRALPRPMSPVHVQNPRKLRDSSLGRPGEVVRAV